MVLGESANALTSFTSARFSSSWSGGRDGRRCNSSVYRIDSRGTTPAGIELSIGASRLASGYSVTSTPPSARCPVKSLAFPRSPRCNSSGTSRRSRGHASWRGEPTGLRGHAVGDVPALPQDIDHFLHRCEVCAKKRADLRDRGEDLLGRRLLSDERRHPPQRRLLLGKTCPIGGGCDLYQPPLRILPSGGAAARLATCAA
jgi:hypothetical protein